MRNHLGPIIPDDYDPYYIQDWPPQPPPAPRARIFPPWTRAIIRALALAVLAVAGFVWGGPG